MRALALSVVLAMVGCGPTLLWASRSPDRRARVTIVRRGEAEVLTTGGATERTYDSVALDRLRWGPHGVLVPAQRADDWWVVDGEQELGPFVEVGPLSSSGEHVAFAARHADGWHVTVDGLVGSAFDAIGESLLVDPETGAFAYVGRRRGAEQVVWGEGIGPPCTLVAMLSLGAKGRQVAYVDRGARDRLLVDHLEAGAWDEVLELALAPDEAHWSALVGEGDTCSLVHDGVVRASAPLLTHLRISDDGAHVACLSPAVDGSSVEVLVDGTAVRSVRRALGEALTFVPGSATLVVIVEQTQGLRIVVGDEESERFEEILGPVTAPGRVGWIGRRGGQSEVAIGMETVGVEPWATSLLLAREGDGFAYVARTDAGRFVVTRLGRWPVPRLFIDTLAIDATGAHWAALVPDASERRLDVFVDGVRHAELDPDEIGAALAIDESLGPADAVRAIVLGELARAIAAD